MHRRQSNIPENKDHSIDLLTLIAIATVVYIIQNVLHEGVGHGGACLLVGGKPLSLSTAYFEWDDQNASQTAKQIVASAGTIVNLLAGLLFWFLLRSSESKSHIIRYFLWLSMTGNFLTATGYPLFSGFLGVGDWVTIFKGIQPIWIWRIGLIISGIVLYWMTIWLSLHELNKLIGKNEPVRLKLAFKLTVLPYIAGSVGSTMGAFLNPISMLFVLTSAASSFGGTSALAWMSQMLKTRWFPAIEGEPVFFTRDWTWIFLAGLLLVFHIFVLGPSIKF